MPTARAVRITGAGGPEVLALGQLELRDPGPHEVLVEVAAAGLNRADTLQRRGFYPAPPGVPADVPGLEIAGTVAAVGEGVTAHRVGDRVMAVTAGGGMATLALVHERELVRVPDGLSLTDAAAVPEVFFTAYDALFVQGEIRLGQVALVHAIGSGIGTAALQLLAATGATCVGTSRTADKLERCADLGPLHGVLVEDGQFADAVKAVARGGAHAVLDTVGAAYLAENLKAVASRGHIVTIGLMGGVKGTLDLGLMLAKRVRLSGTVLRSRPLEEKAALAQAFARDVSPLLASGRVRPVIDAVLPMADVAEAHRRMDDNRTFGKLVLAW